MTITPRAVVCGHCLQKERMPIAASHRAGELCWQVLACTACAKLSVRCARDTLGADEAFRWDVVYPAGPAPRGLTGDLARAYSAALAVRTIDPSTYAGLLAMVIDIACTEHAARGANVAQRLRDLADRALIPAALADGARSIVSFVSLDPRNAGTVDVRDLPTLEPLCEALVLYARLGPELLGAIARATVPPNQPASDLRK